MSAEYFNSLGGFSAGLPEVPVIDANGNVITNVLTNGNVFANVVYATYYKFANGQPFSGGGNSTPGGNNTQLQYNNNGTFAGIPNVTWNGNILSLGNVTALSIGGGIDGYFLQTDGAGNLTWAAGGNGGSGNPGGSNTQVQFNDAGIFGGDVDFKKDKYKELETALRNIRAKAVNAWDAINGRLTSSDIKENIEKLKSSVGKGNEALNTLKGTMGSLIPETKRFGQETGNALSKYQEILLKLKTAQAGIDTKSSLFGDDAFVLKQSALKSALDDILSLEGGVTKYKSKIAELGAELRVVEGIIANNEATKKRNEYMQEIKDVVDGMSYTQENLNRKTSLYNDILNSAIKTLGPANKAILRLRDIINQNSQALTVNVAGWKGLISDNGQVTEWVNNVGDSFKSLNERLKDKALEGMTKQFENLKSSAQSFGDESRDIFDVIGKSIGIGNNRLQEFASTMSYAIGSIGAISSQLFENRRAQLDNYYERERAYIESSKLTEEAKASAILRLEEQVSKKKRRIAHDEAKAQKRRAIFEATLGAANAIINALKLGPIAGPIAAAFIGGLALAQIGSIASAPLPALAGGGLAYGPTTAIVGDNRNAASDPEVIAPLSKLQNMLNGGEKHIVVTGAIKGQDILLSNRYGADTASRYRA